MDINEVKNWNTDVEKAITEDWQKKDLFSFDVNTKKRIYSIDTPPPYVNTPIHMGHAVTYCYMDFFARYKRMKGFEVLFPLGLDRNGLPIEMAAEKKYKISPFKEGREKFIEACKKILEESSAESVDSFARLGISFSSYKEGNEIGRIYNTDSPEYRKLTQETFVDLFKNGIIYEDKRINIFDPKLRTTISNSEVEYKEIDSTFNDIEWKVKGSDEKIVIGTTRPELIATCKMVIFNPEDDRYKHLEGKTAISPIFESEVQIKAHPLAQIDKGTGLVMMCSAGDMSDIVFFRDMKLTTTIAINEDGRMNEHAGPLEGLKVKEAREKMIELVRESGLLKNQVNIKHRTPISERSKAEIEFIEMPEFYLKQLDQVENIRKISNDINFYPENSKNILEKWLESISIDWPISRRRYYATPIPMWYSGQLIAFPPKGTYVEPFRESPPANSIVIDKDSKEEKGTIENFQDEEWTGETRILDTWFDSSISELNMLKYKSNDDFFQKAYPASLRPQGKEIVRTWLYYTLLRGYLETGKACFSDVWIHNHILDEKGLKMSKSLGNIIDPQDIINNEGAEALRLWSATEGDLSTGDLACSRDKIRAEKKTINKLLNINKFANLFEKQDDIPNLTKTDVNFINHIEGLTNFCDENFEKYNFFHPGIELRKFLWDTFASNYIELVKNRAYNEENKFSEDESNSAKYTIHFLLERLITLLYPIIPQVTSLIAESRGIDLHSIEWKNSSNMNFEESRKIIDTLSEFNSTVWKEKKEKKVSLKSPIEGIFIPKELMEFESDLKAAHGI